MTNSTGNEESPLRLRLRLTETWLQSLADAKDLTVPVGDQYQLHHFIIKIEVDRLIINAEIVDKPGSSIELSCKPSWDAQQQRILLEDVDIKTKSKNLLVKSAGWMANSFFQGKVDKKLEDQINHLYQTKREWLLADPLSISFKERVIVNINANAFLLHKMELQEGAIDIDIEVNGVYKVELNS